MMPAQEILYKHSTQLGDGVMFISLDGMIKAMKEVAEIGWISGRNFSSAEAMGSDLGIQIQGQSKEQFIDELFQNVNP